MNDALISLMMHSRPLKRHLTAPFITTISVCSILKYTKKVSGCSLAIAVYTMMYMMVISCDHAVRWEAKLSSAPVHFLGFLYLYLCLFLDINYTASTPMKSRTRSARSRECSPRWRHSGASSSSVCSSFYSFVYGVLWIVCCCFVAAFINGLIACSVHLWFYRAKRTPLHGFLFALLVIKTVRFSILVFILIL